MAAMGLSPMRRAAWARVRSSSLGWRGKPRAYSSNSCHQWATDGRTSAGLSMGTKFYALKVNSKLTGMRTGARGTGLRKGPSVFDPFAVPALEAELHGVSIPSAGDANADRTGRGRRFGSPH